MKYLVVIASVAFLAVLSPVRAQDCKPPAIVFNAKTENIFSPEQEMHLGDAMMERLEKDYRVFSDEQINSYLQSIGDRITKHLPPSGIRFRFVVVDTPYTNAHAMAGGRIFVTRKMISFVRNEDELAGVIAHELGHAVVRHHAIDISRYFKQILGIGQVGDRGDIFEKYNRFLELNRTKQVKFSENHEDNQQIEADRIGVYAAYAAGYDPEAFTEFWKRFTEAKKGNFFTDLFGSKTLADKRLREMLAAMKQIPANCLDKLSPTASQDFEKWRRFVINFSTNTNKEALHGLIYKRPLVPLRGDITHLRFSPDGKYILAQDVSTITVLTREPLAVHYRVEMEDAFPAAFSRDSRQLIAYSKNLRVQKWDIEQKDLISADEIAIRGGYWQTRVSPDGKYLACYRYSGELAIYDVATNTEIFRKKEFYLPTYGELLGWQLTKILLDQDEYPAINIEFSPDGKYLLAGRKRRAAFGPSREETIAIDLTTRKPFSLGSNIEELLVSSMDFMAPDKVIGQFSGDIKKSGIFAFPSGQRHEQFELSGASFTTAHAGDYVAVRPVLGAAVGVYDLKAKKYVLANKKSALDVYGNTFVAERKNGEIALYTMGTNQPVAAVSLPASPLTNLRTSAVSPDGNWLAASDSSRGAAWNLQTGERVLHIRAFRGSYFTPDGKIYADFPKLGDTQRSIAIMDPTAASVTAAGNLESDGNVRQHGPFLLVRKSNEKKEEDLSPEEKKKRDERRLFSEEEPDKAVGYRNTTFEIRNVRDGQPLWTRKFESETPSYSMNHEENRLAFWWPLNSKAAKDIVAASPDLTARVAKMQEKVGDRLIQLVEANTGKVTGHFLLETGEGSISVDRLGFSGDYLVVGDTDNRVLVYSMQTGEVLYRFFGNYSATSGARRLIAVENLPGRVAIYDLVTGRELERLSFTRPVTRMNFLDDGKRFFVLTSDQTAFMFDSAKLTSASRLASQE